ncbi:FAD-binding oxidoreductase [Streptomyces sp. NPDC049916]|uniref:FAD-binding oxidoreductase n=1 Tax=Streptomyces sp. NPDC049916 TaxID=3155156 RepID=UPI00341B05FE
MSVDTVSLTGWGRTAPTTAVRFRPRSQQEAVAVVRGRGPRGALARGSGRAPGDAAQNAGGSVLDMTGLARIGAVDPAAGTVRCEAGVSLERLLRVLLPLGWLPPVLPEAGGITVGGAIGSDVHGSGHPADGSFTRHVGALELLTADGEVRTVLPGTALFEATAGGLGLTGVILSATLRLRRAPSARMLVSTERAGDLDEVLARLTAGDDRQPYASAWLDLLARGRATGRGIITRGEHAPPEPYPAGEHTPPFVRPAHDRRIQSARRTAAGLLTRAGALSRTGALAGAGLWSPAAAGLPALPVPGGPLGRASAALCHEIRYRSAPRARGGESWPVPAFFLAPDAAPGTDRLHGGGGLVRYRFSVGYDRTETLHRVVRRIAAYRAPVLRAVLRRFGAADPGWLSFASPGWVLALDLPAALPSLARLLDGVDEEVAAAGGRVCLAADSRMRPETAAAMYPRLAEFRALREALGATDAFRSDLARRLGL